MRLLIQILLLLTCLLQASPIVASSNFVIPTHTPTFSTQVIQKVESEQKVAVFHFARSGIEKNAIKQTTSHFSSSKQSPSYLKDVVQNFGVLQLEKSLVKSWVGSIHFYQKEKLSLLENRTRVMSFNVVNGAGDDLLNAFKPGYSIESIKAIPKGSRPNPSTYLNQSYIDAHLTKFNDGAVRFTSRNSFNQYGTLGPDGGFVLSKSDFDKIIKETGGDLRQIEQKLGLDANYLDGSDVMIVYIDNPSSYNLRIPSGNEGGANQYWLPGGKTSGGVNEAVMDFSDSPNFTEIILE